MIFSGHIRRPYWEPFLIPRVYQVAEYLRNAGRSMEGLIGYDLLTQKT